MAELDSSSSDYSHLAIYLASGSSVGLLVWLLSQIIRHPERFVQAINENQRHQVREAELMDDGADDSAWISHSVPMSAVNLPVTHNLTCSNPESSERLFYRLFLIQ